MLKKQYDEKLAQKEELRRKSEDMEMKLERAGLLVSGLASEKARWEETVKVSSGPPPPRPALLPARQVPERHPLSAEGHSGDMGTPGCRDIQGRGTGVLPPPIWCEQRKASLCHWEAAPVFAQAWGASARAFAVAHGLDDFTETVPPPPTASCLRLYGAPGFRKGLGLITRM